MCRVVPLTASTCSFLVWAILKSNHCMQGGVGCQEAQLRTLHACCLLRVPKSVCPSAGIPLKLKHRLCVLRTHGQSMHLSLVNLRALLFSWSFLSRHRQASNGLLPEPASEACVFLFLFFFRLKLTWSQQGASLSFSGCPVWWMACNFEALAVPASGCPMFCRHRNGEQLIIILWSLVERCCPFAVGNSMSRLMRIKWAARGSKHRSPVRTLISGLPAFSSNPVHHYDQQEAR